MLEKYNKELKQENDRLQRIIEETKRDIRLAMNDLNDIKTILEKKRIIR